jgi:hypothetical protein
MSAYWIRMVRAERFELPTFWFVARRSIQLSYARMRTTIDYQTGSKTPNYPFATGSSQHPRIHGTPLLDWTDLSLAGQFRG